jgi:hypothetical protein
VTAVAGGVKLVAMTHGYHVVTSAPGGHAIPALLAAFGDSLATKNHGVGWFDVLEASVLPDTWSREVHVP